MALVRVYCGLASAPPAATARSSASAWLTAAVVDDAGRLLDVCDISDDAVGYAELGALLSERSGGTAGVAVAADSAEHQITLLLAAAGRPLSIADEESLDDYAERFGDDDSPDEIQAATNERRAVGLARALQAGALAASVQGAPRELMALKPVLAAHAALATGRQGAAVALREVLRELYPAALRAYPDPAEPIPLAILDALPEPGLLATGTASRNRDAEVAAQLAEAGVADLETVAEAITSLRVAIAETPRRAGIGKSLTAAVGETVRQAVAAVRACDSGITALVGLLTEKATSTTPTLAPPPRPAAPAARSAAAPPPARTSTPPPPARTPAAPPPARTPATPPPARTPAAPAAARTPAAPLPARTPAPPPPSTPDEPRFDYPAAPAARSGSIPAPRAAAEARPTEPAYEPAGPQPGIPAPGSRADWPLNPGPSARSDQAVVSESGSYAEVPEQRPGRVTPPWQDMPSEPPALRLVEPEPLREPRHDYDQLRDSWSSRSGDSYGSGPALPSDDSDGDLLIFAEASAWFTGYTGEHPPINWSNPADEGWLAAEKATTHPVVEDETTSGLPRRVPQANLVPGSALPSADRPLRIVRDPAAMAQHTTGYFRGSRRGEEVRGFAVGGRPGREAAGGWDFSREGWESEPEDADRGYEYRSAARR
ncbi:MAG: hypothetical protein AUG44_19385 [Actinobacteria bacterium 13_1_20CM_3_71_11]|nr:MAG: hypothetical protein AUG44_19385 [Actinobacteria bacterium 13_1_20CM_3_71_11]